MTTTTTNDISISADARVVLEMAQVLVNPAPRRWGADTVHRCAAEAAAPWQDLIDEPDDRRTYGIVIANARHAAVLEGFEPQDQRVNAIGVAAATHAYFSGAHMESLTFIAEAHAAEAAAVWRNAIADDMARSIGL